MNGVTVLGSTDEFSALRPYWNGLAADSTVRSFFKTYEWLHTWWMFYRDRLDGAALQLLVSGPVDAPLAILPAYGTVMRIPPLNMRVNALNLLGNRFEGSEYLGTVGASAAGGDAYQALIAAAAAGGCDILYFENVREDEPLVAAAEEYARNAGAPYLHIVHHRCPYIRLNGTTWDTLLQSRSESLRSDYRRQARRFFAGPGAVFGAADDTAAAIEDLRDLFRLHRLAWQGREGTSSLAPGYRQEFHERLLTILDGTGHGRVFTLKRTTDTIAALYGFEYGGEFYYFQTGTDPAAARRSAGKLLLGSCIEHGCGSGWKTFDFLRGNEAYKKRWTAEERTVCTVALGITAKGRRTLRLWQGYRRAKYGLLRVVKRSGN